jgi:hypothetical protein
VFGAREQLEVLQSVVAGVSVAVMDHGAIGDRPMREHPDDTMHGFAAPLVTLAQIEASRRPIVGATEALREMPANAPTDRAEAHGTLGRVPPRVLGLGHEFQVFEPIVPGVIIAVVDDEPLWDWAMCGDPDEAMEQFLTGAVGLRQIASATRTRRYRRAETTGHRTEPARGNPGCPRRTAGGAGARKGRLPSIPGLLHADSGTILSGRLARRELSAAVETALHTKILSRRPSSAQDA